MLKTLEALVPVAERVGVRLAVEVIPNALSTARQLVRLIEDEDLPALGICLDVGHARLQGDVVEALETVAGYLVTTHLHDNGGRKDDHLLPFDGVIDWPELLIAFQKVGYDGTLMFELAAAADGPSATLRRAGGRASAHRVAARAGRVLVQRGVGRARRAGPTVGVPGMRRAWQPGRSESGPVPDARCPISAHRFRCIPVFLFSWIRVLIMPPVAYIQDIAQFDGQDVTLRGWLHNRRSSGKIHFLIVRDGTGFIQVVMSKADIGEDLFARADHLAQETAIIVTGRVRADARAKGGFELTGVRLHGRLRSARTTRSRRRNTASTT